MQILVTIQMKPNPTSNKKGSSNPKVNDPNEYAIKKGDKFQNN